MITLILIIISYKSETSMLTLVLIIISILIYKFHRNMALENILYKEDYYSLFPKHVIERDTEKIWHLYVVNIAKLCMQRNVHTRLHTHETSLIPAYKINIKNHVSSHYISYLFYLHTCVGGIGFKPTGQKKIYSCSYQVNKCERLKDSVQRLEKGLFFYNVYSLNTQHRVPKLSTMFFYFTCVTFELYLDFRIPAIQEAQNMLLFRPMAKAWPY